MPWHGHIPSPVIIRQQQHKSTIDARVNHSHVEKYFLLAIERYRFFNCATLVYLLVSCASTLPLLVFDISIKPNVLTGALGGRAEWAQDIAVNVTKCHKLTRTEWNFLAEMKNFFSPISGSFLLGQARGRWRQREKPVEAGTRDETSLITFDKQKKKRKMSCPTRAREKGKLLLSSVVSARQKDERFAAETDGIENSSGCEPENLINFCFREVFRFQTNRIAVMGETSRCASTIEAVKHGSVQRKFHFALRGARQSFTLQPSLLVVADR